MHYDKNKNTHHQKVTGNGSSHGNNNGVSLRGGGGQSGNCSSILRNPHRTSLGYEGS